MKWPGSRPFIQAALGETRFYPYADPLADVIVNLAEAGNGFTPTDENYAGVEAVLDGDPRLIRTLHLEPGDLQIFKGRYSLHRVTPLSGLQPRYVGIFSFVEEPGMVSSPERTRQLYRRVLPIHIERAGLRRDALID